jgi:P4 family phage/plasmid primase-like protien
MITFVKEWQDEPAEREAFIYTADGRPLDFAPMFVPGTYADRHHVLHDAATRTFYEYEEVTGLWRPTTPDTMRRKLAAFTAELGTELGCSNIAEKAQSDSKLNAGLNNLRALTDGQFSDRPHGIIHCRNGMLEVATGQLHPFAPRFKSRNACPFPWDESATCPRFIAELLEPAIDADDIGVIQLYAGMVLMGRNLAQRLLLLTGTPGGGKSQLVIALEGLIGRENCSQLRTELLAERFELARFVAKTLLTGKDVPGDFLMSRGAYMLKSLCGGDSLETEVKGKMGGSLIDGEFCAIVTSNSRLRVRLDGDTGAWRRRLIIVNYERPKPARPIPDFARQLLEQEGAGILRWAVEGARRLLELDYQFPITAAQQSRVDSLLDESDALRSFVGTCLVAEPGASLPTAAIVEAFFAYCDKRGWATGSVREVERNLPDALMEIHRAAKSHSVQHEGKTAKGFRGVKFAEGVAQDDKPSIDPEEGEPFSL